MINVSVNSQIDVSRWNGFIKNEIHYRFEWLYIIKNTYQLEPYFIMVHDKDKFALIATFKIKNQYVSLPYLSYAGFQYNDNKLLELLRDYLNKNNIKVESRELQKHESSVGYVNPVVDISSFESFWKNISKNTRNQFKKSEKNKFIFQEDKSLKIFYELYTTSMHRLGTPPHKEVFFTHISNYLDSVILSIYDSGKPIGSMFCIYGNNKFFIAYAATLPDYKTKYANYFLYLNAIRWMSERNLTLLDMGRSTYGQGTFLFKKKFKPKFFEIKSSNVYTKSYKMKIASTIWKKLPLPVANYIGPKVRKYLV